MIKQYLVDVFANEPYQGNLAGVVEYNSMTDDEMLSLAKSFDCSNSAFIKKVSDGVYNIRWFTRNSEAPLCGHASIAATKILYENKQISNKVTLQYKGGSFEVNIEDDMFVLTFPKMETSKITNDLAQTIVGENAVFSGVSENCLLFQLSTEQQVKSVVINRDALISLPYRAAIITAKSDNGNYDYVTRYFAPKVGIEEDPVCASAQCRLAPFWEGILNKNSMNVLNIAAPQAEMKVAVCDNTVLISGKAVILNNMTLLNRIKQNAT